MARPKKPATPSSVTQNRYLRLRLEAQRVELMARHIAGASLQQLVNWFEHEEETPVTTDEMREAVAKWEKNTDGSL